jgi:hypothetical protein
VYKSAREYKDIIGCATYEQYELSARCLRELIAWISHLLGNSKEVFVAGQQLGVIYRATYAVAEGEHSAMPECLSFPIPARKNGDNLFDDNRQVHSA